MKKLNQLIVVTVVIAAFCAVAYLPAQDKFKVTFMPGASGAGDHKAAYRLAVDAESRGDECDWIMKLSNGDKVCR